MQMFLSYRTHFITDATLRNTHYTENVWISYAIIKEDICKMSKSEISWF